VHFDEPDFNQGHFCLETGHKRALALREYAEGKTTHPADTFQINIDQQGNQT